MIKIFSYLAAAAVMILCGCADVGNTADRMCFKQITEDLDFNGSCLFVSSSSHAGVVLEKLQKDTERKVWNSGLPESSRFRLQHFISTLELAARIGGINEIRGWGGSSVNISGTQLFRNRFKLLLPPDNRGALWQLPATQNIHLGSYLQNLPDDTLFAGVFNIDTSAANRMLNTDKRIKDTVDKICNLLLGEKSSKLLSLLSGIWKIVVVCDEKCIPERFIGMHVALTIPDRDGKIFELLNNRSKMFTGVKTDTMKQTIQLGTFNDKLLSPLIQKGNGDLTIFSTPEARFRTIPLQSTPAINRKQKRLLKYTDDMGVAAVYRRNAVSDSAFLSVQNPGREEPSLGFLKRMPDGLFFEEISSYDINSYALCSVTALPIRMIFDIFTAPDRTQKKVSRPRAAAQPVKIPVKKSTPAKSVQKKKNLTDECLKRIAQIGNAIKKEAAEKKFPPYGIKGLRELAAKKKIDASRMCCPRIKSSASSVEILNYANCHYLYFGEPEKNSPKSPLIMELPFLHKKYIAVYYADGSFEKIPATGDRSVRRNISVLHTMHAYGENEFLRLMRIAEEFDKILER